MCPTNKTTATPASAYSSPWTVTINTSSGVNVHTAETSLDWWIPTLVVESLFKGLEAELGASQQGWHEERGVGTLQQLPELSFLSGLSWQGCRMVYTQLGRVLLIK